MPHNDILNFERGYDMKLHYLGTCSGTEPMPGMHHTSTVLETGGLLYWLDAGECCVHTAHNRGMDVMQSRAVFISHPHLDHVGGLANLLHCISKFISPMFGRTLTHGEKLSILTPDMEVLKAVHILLRQKNFTRYDERLVKDGLIYEDENIRVTAFHNHHLKDDGVDGVWHSFSYRIEAEGKCIIYSGDLKSPAELDAMNPETADLVIMETGQASVSMLQRRLKLGYARAARIVDEMEEQGIVGPFVGSKPRAILITKEQWENMKNGQQAQIGFDDIIAQDQETEN